MKLVLLLLFLDGTAGAHQIGQAEWCLAYTAYHRECLYKTEPACTTASKPVAKYFKKNKESFAAILTENPSATRKSTFDDFDIHCEQNMSMMPSKGL